MESKMISKALEEYKFDINDYEIVDPINSGGYGDVNLVKNKKSGQLYAAKTNKQQNDEKTMIYFDREINILIKVQHPTIIQFRGISYLDFSGSQKITILMDYMQNGSLADLIAKEGKKELPNNFYNNTQKQIILIGIAEGMMILHKNHIIHRDLKPENVLIDSNLFPHITDFGLSKIFDPDHSMSQSIAGGGTAAYMAPEVIKSDRYNTKADVYSFGILMYEVVTGRRAYHDILFGRKKITAFTLYNKVIKGLRPKFDGLTIKEGIVNLIKRCWSKNPSKRPTFCEIFKKLSLSKYSASEQKNNEIKKEKEEEEEEEEEDNNEVEIEEDVNDDDDDDMTKYCLDDVDYDKIYNYAAKFTLQDQEQKLNDHLNRIESLEKKLKDRLMRISNLDSKISKYTKKS